MRCRNELCGGEMTQVGMRVWECPNDHRTDPPTHRPAPLYPDMPRFDPDEPLSPIRDVSLPQSSWTSPIPPSTQPVVLPRAEGVIARNRPSASDSQILDSYQRLGSAAKVASELRVSQRNVTKVLQRAGVRYGNGPIPAATDEQMREAFDRLESVNAVCRELNVGFRTVKRALARREVSA